MRGINLPTLPVRVLDFLPRCGDQGERLTAILDRCPELLDLNLKIGVGMKILDTVPWISREYSQLSATLPSFQETGWFNYKVPLYIISLGDDSGIEVPLQSWCFGQFEYKSVQFSLNHSNQNNNLGYSIAPSVSLEASAPFKNTFLVHDFNNNIPSYDFNSSIPMNTVSMNCISIDNFNPDFIGSDIFPTGKPVSLSQEVLQRVDSNHPNISEMDESLFTDTTSIHSNVQNFSGIQSGIQISNHLDKPIMKPDTASLLKDIFVLPDYQPRFRMSTYNTHLKTSLENAKCFPHEDTAFDINMLLSHDNNNNINSNLEPTSTFDHMNTAISCNELNALLTMHTENNINHSPTTTSSFSSLSTPPDVSIQQEIFTNSISNIPNKNVQEIISPKKYKRTHKDSDFNDNKKIKIPSPSNEKHNDIDLLSPPPSGKLYYPKLQPKPTTDDTPIVTFTKKNTENNSHTSLSDIIKESTYSHLDKQPYHGVLNRADLVLQTDIETMVSNWTPEENEVGRRLLRFQRRHEENTLYCQFEPISQTTYLNSRSISPKSEDMPKRDNIDPSQIVISVIYWPGLQSSNTKEDSSSDYYITSVDVVNLLEGLLGVIFTLEEKNRIRRNLELFGPITVGKGTSHTGDLFRRIMAFPEPRPRNIEKGIKVFPYHQLPQALRKVVGKHTASRSSTLRVNLLPLESLSSFPTTACQRPPPSSS